jgi:hypothetical protein
MEAFQLLKQSVTSTFTKQIQQASKHGFQHNHNAADHLTRFSPLIQFKFQFEFTTQKLQVCYIHECLLQESFYRLWDTEILAEFIHERRYKIIDLKWHFKKFRVKAMDMHASTSRNAYLSPRIYAWTKVLSLISGFRHDVDVICGLLGTTRRRVITQKTTDYKSSFILSLYPYKIKHLHLNYHFTIFTRNNIYIYTLTNMYK